MSKNKALTAAAALIALAGLTAPAHAISVQLSYGGTTVQLDDGDPGDQDGTANFVDYVEGDSGSNFSDFSDLVVQGSRCPICATQINFTSEVAFNESDADGDLLLRVSETGLNLGTSPEWFGESNFTSIFGDGTAADYATYWDPGNTLFGTTNLIHSAELTATEAKNFQSRISPGSSPFSLTVEVLFPEAELEAAGQSLQSTGQASVSPVPLPAGLPLLVAGIGALGVLVRFRKTNAA